MSQRTKITDLDTSTGTVGQVPTIGSDGNLYYEDGGSGSSAGFTVIEEEGTGSLQVITLPYAPVRDNVLVFVGALWWPDFTLTGDELSLTTNAPGDDILIYLLGAGFPIGLAPSYMGVPNFRPNANTHFGVNNFGGRVITVDRDCTITHVVGFCTTANPSTTTRPAIYSASGITGNVDSLLVQGPQLVGVPRGLFELELDTPLSVQEGDILYLGIQILGSALGMATVGGIDTYFFGASGALPSTAPGASYGGGTSNSVWARIETRSRGGSSEPWYWKPPKVADFPNLFGETHPFTLIDDSDVGLMFQTSEGNTSHPRGASRALPSGVDWTATMRLEGSLALIGYANMFMCVHNNAEDRFFLWGWDGRQAIHFLNFTASGFGGYEDLRTMTNQPMWYRMSYVQSTGVLTYSFSCDGKNWIVKGSYNITSYLGGDPTFIGIGGLTESSNYPMAFSIQHWNFE